MKSIEERSDDEHILLDHYVLGVYHPPIERVLTPKFPTMRRSANRMYILRTWLRCSSTSTNTPGVKHRHPTVPEV